MTLFFYQHLGHHDGNNSNIYEASSAECEILKVERNLLNIDDRVSTSNSVLPVATTYKEHKLSNRNTFAASHQVSHQLSAMPTSSFAIIATAMI